MIQTQGNDLWCAFRYWVIERKWWEDTDSLTYRSTEGLTEDRQGINEEVNKKHKYENKCSYTGWGMIHSFLEWQILRMIRALLWKSLLKATYFSEITL